MKLPCKFLVYTRAACGRRTLAVANKALWAVLA